MKPRLRIILPPPRGSWPPPRGSRARLPFLLVPVLAAMAVVQMASPEHIALPPAGTVARIALAPLPGAPPVVIAPPLLASRNMFAAPVKRGGPDSANDPLDGAIIAGVVQQGRLRVGVVQQASGPGGPGKVRYVGIGGTIAGWRLAALDQSQARLTHGPAQSLIVTYGLHPLPPGNAGGPQGRRQGSPQTSESGQ